MITSLKIAMIARPNLFKVPGGDTVQVKETAEALRQLGVTVDIHLEGKLSYEQYNLLHFFNVITPEDILGHLYKTQLPYVVSTVYVDYHEYDQFHRGGVIGNLSKCLSADSIAYLKTLAKFILKGERISTLRFFIKGHRASIRYILKNASLLLPNSENEYKRLLKGYGVEKPYKVVPNAINASVFQMGGPEERNLVLCVARIEGQKNQLNIIRALNNTQYKLVFIGASAPNQKKYYEQCRKEAASNIVFIDFMPQQELLNYYRKARVHILASWFETTGLSNLEAAVMGCNLVVGDRGDVRDYLKDEATYCEPGDIESIKKAVDIAWEKPFAAALRERIMNTFIWERAATVTHEAYLDVMKKMEPVTK
jgi:glycosyltransferase involved in cell wall biosynthesis